MIAVLGAMDGEISMFLEHMTGRIETQWKCFNFHSGTMEGRDVVVAKSGVGKVLSAMLTQKLIDEYRPDAVLVTGLAGGLTPAISIGDTVIGKDCIQHDLDATALGFQRGEVPYSPYRIIASDPRLVSIASGFIPENGKLVEGRIVTGDQFFTKAAFATHRYLVDELHGDAVEMEGASVGLVCTVNGVPFVIARTISDKADTNARVDFHRFLPVASLNSYEFVRHILRNF